MDILSLLNIWTPFTVVVAATTTPAHWHELVGASSQLYVVIGGSAEEYELTGASSQLYSLRGSE